MRLSEVGINALNEIVAETDARWQEAGYDLAAFSGIAVDVLGAARAYEVVRPEEILEWFSKPEATELQAGSFRVKHRVRFGQPAILVARRERFYLEALFWLEATTSIHQHGFSGAFQVLHGSSVHTRFDFDHEHELTPTLHLGRLTARAPELLTPGSTVAFRSGPDLIHSLFHLESPSVTLVLRTFYDDGARPQYSYLRPGLAYSPYPEDEVRASRLEALDAFRALAPDDFFAVVERWAGSADPELAFYLLRRAFDRADEPMDQERFLALLNRLESKHPELTRRLPVIFEDLRRTLHLQKLRRFVSDPDLRLFLAIAINVTGLKPALDLLAELYPDRDPMDELVRAASEVVVLSQTALTGLGVDIFDLFLEEHDLDLLPRILRRQPIAACDAERAREIEEAVARSPLFSALLSEG